MSTTDHILLSAIPSTLDGGSALTGQGALEASAGNHLDERPALVTLISTMTPRSSTFAATGGNRGSIDWVGIVNHNLDRRRGSLWRSWVRSFTAGAYATEDLLEHLYPTGSSDVANSSGSHTDVDDDPWATSADYVTAAAAGSWTRQFTFDTPAAALSAVGNDHAVIARAAVGTIPGNGTLTVKLYEAGVYKKTLIDAQQVGDYDALARRIFIGKFSTSDLGTASGADVELRVEAGNAVRLYSLLWVAGLSAGSNDSGFLDVDDPPASSSFGGIDAGLVGEEPTQNDFWTLASQVTFAASEIPKLSVAFVNGTNESSPVNKLGVLAAGKAWQPTINAETATLGVQDASTKGKTLGGQDYGSNRRRRRVASVTFNDLTREQMLELFERIDWRKGRLGPFFVCLFPNDTYAKRISGFWATLGESEQGGVWEAYNASDGNDPGSAIRWRRAYTFEEKL